MSQNETSARPARAKRVSLPFLAWAGLFVLASLPLLVSPVLPTIDFYDHITRYQVLAHVAADPFLAQNYAPNWSLLPNIGLDVVGVGLSRFVSALAAAKIVAWLIFAVQYTGVAAFNRALTGRFNWAIGLLAAPLLYSFIFTWGFSNFLLGLGLVFWGAAAWLTLRRRLVLATSVGVLFALVIFLTHGVAFALYGLLLGGLEIGLYLASSERRAAPLLLRMVALALQAVGPVLLFAASATSKASGGVTSAGQSIQQLAERGGLAERLAELAVYRARTILQVAEGPSLLFDALTFATVLAILGVLAWRRRVRLARAAWPALAIAAALVILVPPAMFGVGYVADRMPLFMAFLAVGALTFTSKNDALERACVAGLAAICLIRLVSLAADWRGYNEDFRDYEAVAEVMPAHQVVGYVTTPLHFRARLERRCEMYGPLLVSLHGHASSLWALPTAQPLVMRGRLLEAIRGRPYHTAKSGAQAAEMHSEAVEALVRQRRFDYLMICDAEKLARPIPDDASVAARQGRFTLLRLR